MERKKKISIIVLIIGIIALICGVVFLLVRILSAPSTTDGEYLVEIGTWEREGSPEVIWDFTEQGKGSLTTNNHENDYEFSWAIDGDELIISTEWLYTLDDTYKYRIDRSSKTLILSDEEGESGDINFRPASSVDTEVTEND